MVPRDSVGGWSNVVRTEADTARFPPLGESSSPSRLMLVLPKVSSEPTQKEYLMPEISLQH